MICKWLAFWGPIPNMSHHLKPFNIIACRAHSSFSFAATVGGPSWRDGRLLRGRSSAVLRRSRSAESRGSCAAIGRSVPPSLFWPLLVFCAAMLQTQRRGCSVSLANIDTARATDVTLTHTLVHKHNVQHMCKHVNVCSRMRMFTYSYSMLLSWDSGYGR